MRGLADQIAVLDGFDLSSMSSGVTYRQNVVDASEGGNYSGGSSFAPGLPLLPSSAGLADVTQDLLNYQSGVLPAKRNVLDASAGANYSGGSSFAPGLPLLPSSAGLAGDIPGVTVRMDVVDASEGGNYSGGSSFAPGLPLLPSSAGLAGCASCGTDNDLMGMSQHLMRGVTYRRNVLDASEGGNYSGGSSFAPGLPLLPSSAGLAGLDAIKDARLGRKVAPALQPMLRAIAGSQTVARLRRQAFLRGANAQRKLAIVRRVRALVLASQGVVSRAQLLNMVRVASAV